MHWFEVSSVSLLSVKKAFTISISACGFGYNQCYRVSSKFPKKQSQSQALRGFPRISGSGNLQSLLLHRILESGNPAGIAAGFLHCDE